MGLLSLGGIRTNLETNVAAKNPVADERFEQFWNFTFVLNRKIGDAAPGVDPAIHPNGLCRTFVDADPAGSATSDKGNVRLKLQISHELREKEPRPEFWTQKLGLFSNETESGFFGEGTLKEGFRIHTNFGTNRPAGEFV
jgi:hypothetical protein